ncbi:MAG TPA: nucleoside-diphosphate sugar epimerase/dehydratase [Dehalococcoidia bacterium]|jgi:FlaA1/EpsC-like NDP-sugar epimerase|nr:nucleoside-diphosphate sugar epimerase/dehydratase [Dehalococcoidia bacterium]
MTTLRDWLRLLPVILLDAAVIVASYAAALALRFDGDVPSKSIHFFALAAPAIAAAYIVGNVFFGIYRTSWKYAGFVDVFNLALSVGVVSIFLFAINAFLSPRHIPLTVNVVAPALMLIALGGIKVWPRLLAQRNPFGGFDPAMKNVLIVGAGHTGQLLAREFLHNPRWQYRPVGYVDDDRRLRGVRIHSISVLGNRGDIPAIVQRKRVDLVALAIPSAGGAAVRDIVGICQSTGIPVRTVPGLRDLVRKAAPPTELREVTVDDLLGREQVEVDAEMCAAALRGKSVMITGAAGYIASELARQVLAFAPADLHLLDVNETGLYDLQRDLEAEGVPARLHIWLCNVADRAQVDAVFRAARADVVFHAAAYKHIPVMEDHPDAALRVNVLGTLNVCEAAGETGVRKLVFVSTDKAVNPDNVYGATKRIGELLVTAMGHRSGTTYAAVRFGNVMGSRGSVVPLFLRQIERGGPVLLTDPETTRYYMSAEEAAALVIQAASFAEQGQIFLLDMGERIKTADLAEKMIRLKGLAPGRDIQIVYTGLRPGEKLHEELVAATETLAPTHHPKIFLTQGRPVVGHDELVAKIRELAGGMPVANVEIAARLHALARIDLRDTGAEPLPALDTRIDPPAAP